MIRIGVFICHCGTNIAGIVDLSAVAEACRTFSHVEQVEDYKYLCSDPGQRIIKEAIKQHKLTQVVIGSCSPRMHEKTFQKAIAEAGLNPFMLQVVNLREHCSWVHTNNPKEATLKAIQ